MDNQSNVSTNNSPHPTITSISLSLRDCTDSLASLHQRMDRFYSWASQLQVEHRDLKQRVGFIEGVMTQELDDGDVAVEVLSFGQQ